MRPIIWQQRKTRNAQRSSGARNRRIDQDLAAKAFPNQNAVGKRLLVRVRTPEPEWVEVIGVVAHQRQAALTERGREQIYFTDAFLGHGAVNNWALRFAGDPATYAAARSHCWQATRRARRG